MGPWFRGDAVRREALVGRRQGGTRAATGTSRAAALWLPVVVAFAQALLASPAAGQEAAPPPVRLDRLLKLPSSVDYDVERRGGASRTEWRGRFKAAQAELVSSKKDLEQAMAKLEKAAAGSDQWRFVPPGGDVTAENQDNLRIRMDVTKKREAFAHAEKGLKDLEVEANLAAVPPEWRE